MPVLPETAISGTRQIPEMFAGFAGTPLGVPETGNRECQPQLAARRRNATWLVDALRRAGWCIQVAENCTYLETRKPLSRRAAEMWRELAPEVHAVLLAEAATQRNAFLSGLSDG
jgi:hypothetical protein